MLRLEMKSSSVWKCARWWSSDNVVFSFQNRGSSRRRSEPVNVEDQDKPFVCDSKRKGEHHVLLVNPNTGEFHGSSFGSVPTKRSSVYGVSGDPPPHAGSKIQAYTNVDKLGQNPREREREIASLTRLSPRTDESHPHFVSCAVFPFIVCFCVFSVPDKYKQKHNSKKAEEGI